MTRKIQRSKSTTRLAFKSEPGHWRLQDAKARFSELVRKVRSEGPQHVTANGRDEVVVIAAEDFRRLNGEKTGQALINALQASPRREIDLAPARSAMTVRDADTYDSYRTRKMAAAQTSNQPNVSGVALGLLLNRGSKRGSSSNSFAVRRWIEKQLADVGGRATEMSGIELHREIEAGIPGRAIPTLLTALDITKEEFSGLLGRTRKTLNELLQRERLSRADSDLLYRVSRALVHAVSVFEDAAYAVQWLKEPNEALGGIRPLGLLATVEGDEVVHAELGAIAHGLPV